MPCSSPTIYAWSGLISAVFSAINLQYWAMLLECSQNSAKPACELWFGNNGAEIAPTHSSTPRAEIQSSIRSGRSREQDGPNSRPASLKSSSVAPRSATTTCLKSFNLTDRCCINRLSCNSVAGIAGIEGVSRGKLLCPWSGRGRKGRILGSICVNTEPLPGTAIGTLLLSFQTSYLAFFVKPASNTG